MLQAVRERQYRLTVIQDIVDRLRMVIHERAAAGRVLGDGAAPGAGTGLLVRMLKSLRDGKKIKIHEFWEIDGVTIQKLYDGLKQAAIEAGEWQEEARAQPQQGPDLSHFNARASLRGAADTARGDGGDREGEGRDLAPVMLEASAGSVRDATEETADSADFSPPRLKRICARLKRSGVVFGVRVWCFFVEGGGEHMPGVQ